MPVRDRSGELSEAQNQADKKIEEAQEVEGVEEDTDRPVGKGGKRRRQKQRKYTQKERAHSKPYANHNECYRL